MSQVRKSWVPLGIWTTFEQVPSSFRTGIAAAVRPSAETAVGEMTALISSAFASPGVQAYSFHGPVSSSLAR